MTRTVTTKYRLQAVRILVSVGVFLLASGILYYNERGSDLSRILGKARFVDETQIHDSSLDGTLVAVAGVVHDQGDLGDGLFLKPNPNLSIKRTVLMYQPVSATSKKADWLSSSTSIHMPILSTIISTPTLLLGGSTLDSAIIRVHGWLPVDVSSHYVMQDLPASAVVEESGAYLYLPAAAVNTNDNPGFGDMRISYAVVPSGQPSTFVGSISHGKLVPWVDPKTGKSVYELILGGREQVFGILHAEQMTPMRWTVRILLTLGLAAFLALYIRQ